MDVQRKVTHLELALSRYQMELEQRVTEKVLENLSVRVETNGALNEIKSLREAIERLGK